ncbi:protein HEG homolog 1 isoform X2 [Sceloporus undulatus]|uniref:protein HEG homolog 1 isoform X2 n=1 Tax=Sceloporus undulatus TaxID=8520 RepID=UPI001C4D0A61|nr:protein HEG homolog 1 isoform X2 [Sceloporus undulatus]
MSHEIIIITIVMSCKGLCLNATLSSTIMSKQEVMERLESLDTETRTSNSHTYNTDAFHTLGSGKGRTLRTIANSAPASIAVTGSSTSHTEMIRSGHLTHHSSSVMRIRRIDEASPNTVDTAKFETVTLRISSPKIPVASISEVNHSATESSHHMDSHWKADSTTSDLQNKNRNSSNTTNSPVEGPSLFLTENITVADPISQREITSSTVHSQFPSQATHSRRRSSTKDATQLAGSSEGTVLNHSYFYSKTSDSNSGQLRNSSVTEKDVSISQNDSMPVSVFSEGEGERTLRTPRDVSHSHNATQLSKTSSIPVHTSQMDLLLGDPVFTEAVGTKYQAPSGTTAVEDSVFLRTTSNTVGSIPSSHMDSVSAPGLSERGGETMLQTLIDISNSHKTTQISTTNSDEISTASGLPDSSYALTPVQSREMDLSLDNDFTKEAVSLRKVLTEEAVTLSQGLSKTTADEDNGQPNSSSNMDRSVYSSHMESASVPDLSDRDGKRTLKTPGDASSSQNTIQISTNPSSEISTSSDLPDSSSVLNLVQTSQMDLSAGGTEAIVTEAQVSSNTTADEDVDPFRNSSNTESGVSSSHMESASPPGLFDRSGQRTLRTLRDVSSSHSATQISTTTSDEISTSSSLPDSSYALTLVQPKQKDLLPGDTDFTEKAVTHYQDPSETTAVEDTGLLNTSSNIEKSVSISHMVSTSVLGVSDSGEEKTLQTLIDGSTSHKSSQISTASGRDISSLIGLTDFSSVLTPVQTRGMDLSPEDMDFTEVTHTHHQAPSEVTDVKDRQHTFSHFSVEKRAAQTKSVFTAATFARSGNRTFGSLTDWTKSTDTTKLSAFDLEDVTSSDLTQTLSATVQSEKESSLITERDFAESLNQSIFTYSSNISLKSFTITDLSSTRNNLRTNQGSVAERRLSNASTDSLYLSTTSTHIGERTMRSLPDNSTSLPDNSTFPDVVDTPTYDTETSKSSYPALTVKSMVETEKYNVSLNEGQSTGPSTQRSLEYSSLIPLYSSPPQDSSTIGSGQHLVNGSEVSYSYTENTYTSALLSKGEQGMVQSTINTTFPEVTESISLYMEKSSSSELTPSAPDVDSTRTRVDSVDFGTSEPSTETFQTFRLSRMPTSFQSESSDTGTGYQPMSSTDTGKRTSVSHTDSTYISTTFTRGGERTLLSISHNSTLSADLLESSTFYTETSSPSESLQSSFPVNQSRESSMSSGDMDFSVPSTEPLAAHTPQTPEYSSVVNEPHTDLFYSTSDPASASSLSFTSSPPTSLKQDSLPPTQPPRLFASSETSLPPFSSPFPSPFSLTSKTPLITFSHRLSSTALPPLPSLLPSVSSSSSLVHSSEDLETTVPMTTSEETTGVDSQTPGSSLSEYNNQTRTDPSKDSRVLPSTGLFPLLTETTEQLTNHSSPVTVSLEETKDSKRENTSLPGTSVEKTLPTLTTSSPYLLESTTGYKVAKATASTLPRATTPKGEVTTGKKRTDVTYTTLRMPTLASSTDAMITTKAHKVLPFSTTKMSHTTEMTTKGIEKSSVTSAKEHMITTIRPPPIMISSSTTTTETFSVSPVSTKATTNAWSGSSKTFPTSHGKANVCTADTCLNNGKCMMDTLTGKFQCQCLPGWQGEDCRIDVDECLSSPCPASATCTNTPGSFKCTCSLGYWMEKGKCNLVRTFVGQFPLTFNTTGGKYSELHQVEEDIINMLNASLSTLPGYYTSSVKASRQARTIQVSVLSTFSLLSNVTLYDIVTTIRSHIQACKAPTETCQFISNLTLLHRAGGLCKHKDPECDKETSVCVDLDGIAACRCRPGYFKYNKLDHSCRACEDGYKRENNTCVSCPFGLGGFNCGNPYQLITIVIAAAGGGLLLVMGIALIVTCCQKNKNDISKLIFKSGDFQMSPYAEYPKNPRVQEWGRETIEMQENGSTKNLLQMTDVYYMPTNLRNPELERNGAYPPYTGLPGSRHSCIYPGQYNPSFISDDSRRRDYF